MSPRRSKGDGSKTDWNACVWIDPRRCGGTACIGGRRTHVESVIGLVWAGEDIPTVMAEYNITRLQVLNACWFAAAYGVVDVSDQMNGRFKRWGSQWPQRWSAWASEYGQRIWSGDESVPGPPSKQEWSE